jgi:hypothetical protein
MYSIYITAQHTGPDQTSSQTPAPDQHAITASQHDQASGYSTAQHAAICPALRLRYVYVYDTFTLTFTAPARYDTDNIYESK